MKTRIVCVDIILFPSQNIGKKQEDIKTLMDERKQLESRNNDLEKKLHYERIERRKTQEKLEQEARVKMVSSSNLVANEYFNLQDNNFQVKKVVSC